MSFHLSASLKINNIHNWDVSIKEAISIQRELCVRLDLRKKIKKITTVAGADMAIDDKMGYAGIIIYAFPQMVEIERQFAVFKIEFPYVPGLLAFREAPILLKAFEKVRTDPDVIIFDGQGIAHPRGMGIASHMGLFLGKPAIGCAKSRLVGEYKEPGQNVGDWTPLFYSSSESLDFARDESRSPRIIGAVLRTRKNVKPVFVSPGHLIDLQSSIEVVLACLDRTRIPKPTREADRFVSVIASKAKQSQVSDT